MVEGKRSCGWGRLRPGLCSLHCLQPGGTLGKSGLQPELDQIAAKVPPTWTLCSLVL